MAKVIVVGSGLAGLSCAFGLAEQGSEVEMLESRQLVSDHQ